MIEADIYQMQERALRVAGLYDAKNQAEGKEPWTATDYMSGYVGDVGALSKLVMAHEGKRDISEVESKLSHEIGDNFCSLLVLCEQLDIDPAKAFNQTMSELEARLEGAV